MIRIRLAASVSVYQMSTLMAIVSVILKISGPCRDDSLIGTQCDDGDICTVNDVYHY